MTETYIQAGTDPSWIIALGPIPTLLIFARNRRKAGLRPFGWMQIVAFLFFLCASLIGIPFEWIIGITLIIGGLFILKPQPKLTSLALRLTLAIILAIEGVWFLVLGRHGDQLTLRDSRVTFTFIGKTSTVPRSDLTINVIQHSAGWNIRPWGSWTTFYQSGKSQDLGPSFCGFNVYWGPHGLIRGDALAVRFAHWANVIPMVMTKDRSAQFGVRKTPLPGFKLSEPNRS